MIVGFSGGLRIAVLPYTGKPLSVGQSMGEASGIDDM